MTLSFFIPPRISCWDRSALWAGRERVKRMAPLQIRSRSLNDKKVEERVGC